MKRTTFTPFVPQKSRMKRTTFTSFVLTLKRGMTIEDIKCRADLNFEVDFWVNGDYDQV